MSDHKLGDQWIEAVDGVRYLVKAVEAIKHSECPTCFLNATRFSDSESNCESCPGRCMNVKNLGIVNTDGCIPEERTREYPVAKKVIDIDSMMWVWWVGIDRKADINGAKLTIGVKALTKDIAIDAWNHRP